MNLGYYSASEKEMSMRYDWKIKWWKHFCNECVLPKSFTVKRLENIENSIMQDYGFWEDVRRHQADIYSPEEMKEKSSNTYDHCIANMIGMVSMKMAGKIKPAKEG